MTPSAICFDLDATLLDGNGFGSAIEQTCRVLAERYPAIDPRELHAANLSAFGEEFERNLDDWTLGRLSGRALVEQTWQRAMHLIGHTNDTDAAVQLASQTLLHQARGTYRLYDDARELVAAITDAGIPRALITNGASDTQREKLSAMGLSDWFDTLSISGETAIAKPNLGAFAPVMSQFDVPSERIWMVGDNPDTDILGANNAGMTSVWINRSGVISDVHADIEVMSLAELVPLISRGASS